MLRVKSKLGRRLLKGYEGNTAFTGLHASLRRLEGVQAKCQATPGESGSLGRAKNNTPTTHTTHTNTRAGALGTASKSSCRAHTFKYTRTMRQHTREAQPHSTHTNPPLAPTQGVAGIKVIVQCNQTHTRHTNRVQEARHTHTRLKPTHAPLRTKGAAVVDPACAAHPDQVPQTKVRNAGREGDCDLRNPGAKTAGIAGSGVCDSMQAGVRGAYRAQHTCKRPPRPCLQPVRSVLGAAHAPSTRTAQVRPADPPGHPPCV